MKRTILLAGVVSFIMAFAGTITAMAIAGPRAAEAQEARIRAEQFTVVGDNGADRVNLLVGPRAASTVQVLDANGVRRAWINTGGRGGGDATHASFVVVAPDGVTNLTRLGTGRESLTGPWETSLSLRDLQGRIRVALNVAEDGTSSIRLLDAGGNVTWSAP